jgi:hypothetical protein
LASLVLGQRFFGIATGLLGMYEGYATKGNYGMAIINSYTVMNSMLMLFVFFVANRFIFKKNEESRLNNNEIVRRKHIVIGDIRLFGGRNQYERVSFDTEYMMNMMFLLLLFQSSSMSMAILSRLRIVFHPFFLIIVPLIIERCSNKKIVKSGMYLFMLVYFIYTATHTSPGNYGTIPYEFFWR